MKNVKDNKNKPKRKYTRQAQPVQEQPNMETVELGNMMGTAEVAKRIGVKASNITRYLGGRPVLYGELEKIEGLPKPIQKLSSGSIWTAVQIEQWLINRRTVDYSLQVNGVHSTLKTGDKVFGSKPFDGDVQAYVSSSQYKRVDVIDTGDELEVIVLRKRK